MADTSYSGTGSTDLTFVENAFLKLLDYAESKGYGGAAVKLYNDIIQRGRTDPITEKDFSETELKNLKDLVIKKGGSEGIIDYKDYPKAGRAPIDYLFGEDSAADPNMLGGFKYKVSDSGEINITDTWDFNRGVGLTRFDDNPVLQTIGTMLAPLSVAAQIGRKKIPSNSEKGVPVNINIGQNTTAQTTVPLELYNLDDNLTFDERFNAIYNGRDLSKAGDLKSLTPESVTKEGNITAGGGAFTTDIRGYDIPPPGGEDLVPPTNNTPYNQLPEYPINAPVPGSSGKDRYS